MSRVLVLGALGIVSGLALPVAVVCLAARQFGWTGGLAAAVGSVLTYVVAGAANRALGRERAIQSANGGRML